MCVSGMMLDPPRRNRDHEDLTMTTTAKRWVCLAGKLMVVGEGATADDRTLLRLAVLGALLRASDAMAGPAFRHQIAEAAKAGAVTS